MGDLSRRQIIGVGQVNVANARKRFRGPSQHRLPRRIGRDQLARPVNDAQQVL
jgi:hypothetical protein